MFLSIQNYLDTYIEQEEFSQHTAALSIHQKIKEYWAIMDRPSIVSAVLDPRAKLKTFNKEEAINAKNTVQEIMSQYICEYQQTSPISNNKEETPVKIAQKFFGSGIKNLKP